MIMDFCWEHAKMEMFQIIIIIIINNKITF